MPENTCEICGRPITGPVRYRYIDANIKLRVCQNCSRFGKEASKPGKPSQKNVPKFVPSPRSKKPPRPSRRGRIDQTEFVEDFGLKIRKARESQKLTQDQLANRLKEPVSFVKKVEQEKIHPSINAMRKFERILKISLTERAEDQELDFSYASQKPKSSAKGQTLEDIITFKKKKN